MSVRETISFQLNGRPVTLSVPITMDSLTMLRDELKMTGTKYGCGEGECGACTILVDGVSVNACLMFAVDCDGRDVTTIEGLHKGSMSRLQELFVEEGAVQCGFCTPGMIMQATSLLRQQPEMTVDQIRRGIEGNLCRCTGYKKIVDAITAAVHENAVVEEGDA